MIYKIVDNKRNVDPKSSVEEYKRKDRNGSRVIVSISQKRQQSNWNCYILIH